jgi:hypothetical protein
LSTALRGSPWPGRHVESNTPRTVRGSARPWLPQRGTASGVLAAAREPAASWQRTAFIVIGNR